MAGFDRGWEVGGFNVKFITLVLFSVDLHCAFVIKRNASPSTSCPFAVPRVREARCFVHNRKKSL